MSHFAKLDPETNVVIFVTVGRQEDDGREAELCERTGEIYKQTSYNTRGGVHLMGGVPLRKNYAGLGYTYDEARDAFIPPRLYASWLLDEDTCLWAPPIAMPQDGADYFWSEDEGNWIELVEADQ